MNGRRPHALTINYSYDVPNLSQKWNNVVAKAVLDNWQVSGITSFLSGTQAGLQLQLHQRADRRAERHRRDQRRRRAGPTSICDPEPAAGRAHLRAPVQDRVHRGRRPTSSASATRSATNCIGPGLHELGHLGVQERPDGRHASAAVPGRALQRVQHRSVDRASTPAATFDYTTGAQTNPTSAS